MAKYLVLSVEVYELDEDGKKTAVHCSHEESYGEAIFPDRDSLLQCAYEGFDFARNKFLGAPPVST